MGKGVNFFAALLRDVPVSVNGDGIAMMGYDAVLAVFSAVSDDLVNKLLSIDHLNVEDCFCQSHLFTQAATRILALEAERAKTAKLVEAARAVTSLAWRNNEAIKLVLPEGVLEALDAALRDMEAGQ